MSLDEDSFGLTNSNWILAMNGFPSAEKYIQRVEDFFKWQENKSGDLFSLLTTYFQEKRETEDFSENCAIVETK